MKAMTWHGGNHFTLDDVPDPEVKPGFVLVEIDTTGICGTDVHITQGLFPSEPPTILGHEGTGLIVEVGEGVSDERIGQRVVLNHSAHCFECWNCRNWNVSRCQVAPVSSNGLFAQYVALPSRTALELPETLDIETAAMTEPAACCLSGVEMLDIPYRATGLVIGAGIMGLFTAAFMKTHGVDTLVVSEPVKVRREMAKQFGADILHDPNDVPLEEVMAEVTDEGRGFSVTAEAVGKPQLVAACVNVTKPRGQALMIGVCPEGSPLPVDLYDMHFREIKLVGAFGRGNVFHRVPSELSKLNLENVISGRYPLADLPDAITASAEGLGVKFAIKPNN
ncbi:MAG: alcohol dehydrogenase catalytic domain-containing protein [Chloroflexi bacterium]|nr:alcohol dehydrogenase catalytic domain-containing protein [Chloroflexota bacterium]